MPGGRVFKPLPAAQRRRLSASYRARAARPVRRPSSDPLGAIGGFFGNAARGAADFVRSSAPGRRPPSRTHRVGHEGVRQIAEQSGAAAIDRIRRGDVRREDVLLLASMGVAFTPAGMAARGGMAGRMLSLPKGGYGAPLMHGQLGDIMRILAEARQRERAARNRR